MSKTYNEKISYPKWAPEELCVEHSEVRKGLFAWTDEDRRDPEQRDIVESYEGLLQRLLTWECMREAWDEVRKHREAARWLGGRSLELAVVIDSYTAMRGVESPYQPRGEEAKVHENIALLARKLSRVIEGRPLDTEEGGVFRLLPDAFTGLLNRLNPELCDGEFWMGAEPDDFFGTQREGVGARVYGLRRGLSDSLLLHNYGRGHGGIPEPLVKPPSVSEALDRLAKIADFAAEAALAEKRVSERNGPRRKATAAVRLLEERLRRRMGGALKGQQLHKTLASFVSAALNLDPPVDVKQVYDDLKVNNPKK